MTTAIGPASTFALPQQVQHNALQQQQQAAGQNLVQAQASERKAAEEKVQTLDGDAGGPRGNARRGSIIDIVA